MKGHNAITLFISFSLPPPYLAHHDNDQKKESVCMTVSSKIPPQEMTEGIRRKKTTTISS